METTLSILQRFKLNLTQNQADIVYTSYNGAVFANFLYMAEINDMGEEETQALHNKLKNRCIHFHQKRIFFNIPTAICMCFSWPQLPTTPQGMNCRYLVQYFVHPKAYLEGTSSEAKAVQVVLAALPSAAKRCLSHCSPSLALQQSNFGSSADTTANPAGPSVLTVVVTKFSRWWWRPESPLHMLLILNRLEMLQALCCYIFPWKICVQKLHQWPVTDPMLVTMNKDHKTPFPRPTSLSHLILPKAPEYLQSFKYMPSTCKVNRCILRYHRNKWRFSVVYSSFIVNSIFTVSTLTVSLPTLFIVFKKLWFFLPSSIMAAYNYGQVFERSCQVFLPRKSLWESRKLLEYCLLVFKAKKIVHVFCLKEFFLKKKKASPLPHKMVKLYHSSRTEEGKY